MATESKVTGVMMAAISGAITGTMVALMTPAKHSSSKNTYGAITKAAGHVLDATGKVMINVGENLKHK